MVGRVFINYRRDDAIGTAGRLHDRLARALGRGRIFMDVDHIPAGVDFVDHLHKQVSGCKVFLVIIGPTWLDTRDENGKRRIEDPDDFVAVEIAAALARDIRVIPVLVDGALMPSAGDLPEHLKPLVRRNATEVRNSQFGRDADALVQNVRDALGTEPGSARRLFRLRKLLAGAAGLCVLATGLALYSTGMPASVVTAIRPIFDGEKGELEAWTRASNDNLISSWDTYLANWPQGAHSVQVREMVAVRKENRQIITLPGSISGVTTITYTPDGKAVLTSASMTDRYAQYRLYELPSGNLIRSYGASPAIRGGVFTPDGKSLVAFGHSSLLHWWKVDDPATVWDHHNAPGIEWINGLAISPDGQSYAIACSDGTVRLRAVSEDREVAEFRSDQGWTWNVAYSPDGRWLLSGGADGIPRIWDVQAKHEHIALGHQRGVANPLAFSPDSRTAYASGWDDGLVRAYDVGTGALVREINPHVSFVSGLTISRHGRFLIVWSRDGYITVTDLLTGSLAASLRGSTGDIWIAAVAPDGRTMISGGKDELIRIWDTSDIAAHEGPIAK